MDWMTLGAIEGRSILHFTRILIETQPCRNSYKLRMYPSMAVMFEQLDSIRFWKDALEYAAIYRTIHKRKIARRVFDELRVDVTYTTWPMFLDEPTHALPSCIS